MKNVENSMDFTLKAHYQIALRLTTHNLFESFGVLPRPQACIENKSF